MSGCHITLRTRTGSNAVVANWSACFGLGSRGKWTHRESTEHNDVGKVRSDGPMIIPPQVVTGTMNSVL
jgi:hypothetical protein